MRRPAYALVAAALVGEVLLVAGPAHAEEGVCGAVDRDTPTSAVKGPSRPFDLLGMAAAQDQVRRFAPERAAPVRVAVLDTGIREPTDGGLVIGSGTSVSGVSGELTDGAGTEVAGLVAGRQRSADLPVGFAQDVEVVDVRVAVVRDGDTSSGDVVPTAERVAEGLDWVAEEARASGIKVATVAYPVRGRILRKAVERAQDAGVVVVAAIGDRSSSSTPTDASEPRKQEDAATADALAAIPGVVAVNTTAGGYGTGDDSFVLPSSDTTVAVPSAGGVSYGVNGQTCRVVDPSTTAAAAEVAGIVALLWQRFPDDQPEQIVARLINTASGTTETPTLLTGYGVVQPLDALTRPLTPAPDGSVERSTQAGGPAGPVSPPTTPADLLASTRDNAVWWGLIGGGLLVVALLLRPILARRRS